MTKKAQNAIEFLLMVGITIFVFILLLVFISSNFNKIVDQKDIEILNVAVNDVSRHVQLASTMTSGYRDVFETPAEILPPEFVIETRGNAGFTSELVIKNTKTTYSQVVFLEPQQYLQGTLCKGKNEIRKTDYGIGTCCIQAGPCSVTYLQKTAGVHFECRYEDSQYWFPCNNLVAGTKLKDIRVDCDLKYEMAYLTLTENGNLIIGQGTPNGELSTRQKVSILTEPWFEYIRSTSLNIGQKTYVFHATCKNGVDVDQSRDLTKIVS